MALPSRGGDVESRCMSTVLHLQRGGLTLSSDPVKQQSFNACEDELLRGPRTDSPNNTQTVYVNKDVQTERRVTRFHRTQDEHINTDHQTRTPCRQNPKGDRQVSRRKVRRKRCEFRRTILLEQILETSFEMDTFRLDTLSISLHVWG